MKFIKLLKDKWRNLKAPKFKVYPFEQYFT